MISNKKHLNTRIMKYPKIIAILLLTCTVAFYGCKDESNTPVTDSPAQESNDPPPIDFNNTSTTTAQSGANAQGVYHYTCTNGCAGGAASAGNCANCGNALAHNQAYHANQNNTNTNTADPFNQSATAAATGQNAAGVWHYTCSNGCAGGAGSAEKCSSCGTTLVHNTLYHQ